MIKKIRTGPSSIRLGKKWKTTVKLNSQRHTLRKLVIISNYKCNLHCKDCTMFIPFVRKEEQGFFDVERIIADLELLSKGVFIRHVQIQGGEPILYKDLDKLIAYLMTNELASRVSIATNAMMLLSDDQLKLFKKYSVKVRMSEYGLEHQKIDQIEEQCRANGIPCKTHRQITKDGSWLDMGGRYHEEDLKVKEIFDTCRKNDCYTLIDGKFTKCTRSLMGSLVGLYPHFSNDYVDVRKTSDAIGDLRDFLLSERFMDACRYCNGSTGKNIQAGLQLDKEARKKAENGKIELFFP